VQLTRDAPDGWDSRIGAPVLSQGFAEASRAVGYRPRFVEDPRDRALVLLRGVPLPMAWRWTLQAKLYVDRGHPGFLQALLARLRRLGVAHVRINDERHGLPGTAVWDWPHVRPVRRYVYVIDTAGRSDEDLRKPMQDPVPRNIRKAERARVVVDEVRSDKDLRAFTSLIEETSDRIRARHVASVYPAEFFVAAFRSMVPRGQALFLLARADGQPLAGQMYLVSRDRLTYYHGGSTRERELTPKHGSTAAFWHALRLARERDIATFDFGGASPTTDRANVQYSLSDFKRRWGGRLVMVPGADVVLSPLKVAFQDWCLKPLWDRAHPLYLRLFRTA
jgi:Acetyltransferase (GNAT) domain